MTAYFLDNSDKSKSRLVKVPLIITSVVAVTLALHHVTRNAIIGINNIIADKGVPIAGSINIFNIDLSNQAASFIITMILLNLPFIVRYA